MIKVLITNCSSPIGLAIQDIVNVQNNHVFYFVESLSDIVVSTCLPDVIVALPNFTNPENDFNLFITSTINSINILKTCEIYRVKRLINVFCETDTENVSDVILSNGSKLLLRDIEIINLYPSTIYGRYIPDNIISTIINNFQAGDTTVPGTGTELKQFVYDVDFAKLVYLFSTNDNWLNLNCPDLDTRTKDIIVSPEPPITIKDLAIKIKQLFPELNGQIITFDSSTCIKTDTYVPNDNLGFDFYWTSLDENLSM